MNEFDKENIGIIEGMLFLAGDDGLSLKDMRTVLGISEAQTRLCLEA